MEIKDSYLPSVAQRVQTVKSQIDESKSILYRLVLSRDEAIDRGDSKTADEDEFNMKTMVRKIDFLTDVLDQLGE
jgi:hypothetical protein